MTPPIITISGRRNWLTLRTIRNCARVKLMRRSSGSLGRIEIRSSSDDSQFIMFSTRSRLPLNRRKELEAQRGISDHDESPLAVRLAGVVGAGGRQRERPLFVFVGIDADFRGRQVGSRKAVGGSTKQLAHRGVICRCS